LSHKLEVVERRSLASHYTLTTADTTIFTRLLLLTDCHILVSNMLTSRH